MSSISAKRVMISAAGSGCGKTTITCALLEALKRRGLDPVSFKCGPDYIDPMFHKKVLGIDAGNLDTYFAGEDGVRRIMSSCEGGFAVVEGVMGLFDGMSADSHRGSAYEIADITQTPIVLTVDGSGVGRTVISLIKGILLDDEKKLIKGIILNKMSSGFFGGLQPVLEKELSKIRPDVKVLGAFPKNSDLTLGSRHLGLTLPAEIESIKNKIDKAADLLEESIDMKGLLEIMEAAPQVDIQGAATEDEKDLSSMGEGLTLAASLDDAFCFYYKDNIEMFEKRGVKIKYFSPLNDSTLPENIDGILLGGGYPELHLKELQDNKSMRDSIRDAIIKGIPSLAECGGFMYLHKSVTDPDGNRFEMVGVVDGECSYTGHLVRFGYMEISAASDEALLKDEFYGSVVGMRGHEFHYYDSSFNGDAFTAKKPLKNITWNCLHAGENHLWGFPHFYYGSSHSFVDCFVGRMRKKKV
ncbi:MAG: cobyrinate a,c-diamide synthase [Butyrivibrio sp.]|nr:cobyrinate a,c-diamide synthase [Butyrivibrio sp.]